MGKRSSFERVERDYYRTFDPRATAALAAHLPPRFHYVEPCAGRGDLIGLLGALGHVCVAACDIRPQDDSIPIGDALRLASLPAKAEGIITNPPWRRDILHAMIRRFARLGPTWLLFDAGWAFGKQAAEFLPMCSDIVAVGRLRWIPDTSDDGKDDCAWYRFDSANAAATRFHGRRA